MPFSYDQRENRRRRFLTDRAQEVFETSRGTNTGKDGFDGRSLHYGDAEFLDQGKTVLDLLPRRLPVIGLLMLAVLIGVAGLLAGHIFLANMKLASGKVITFSTFNLEAPGGLASWFSSTLLLVSAGLSVLIYQVRRHRKDDYQGVYRVWLWAALCWLIMSVDEAAGLHHSFGKMMTLMTGTDFAKLGGSGACWWVIPYFFLLIPIGIRLLMDMRQCWLSSSFLLASGGCFALAVVTDLGWFLGDRASLAVIVEEGAELAGCFFLFSSMLLHGRFVLLDAMGEIPIREKKEKPIKPKKKRKPARQPRFDDMTDWGDEGLDDEDKVEAAYDRLYGGSEQKEYEYDEDELAAEEAILFGQSVRFDQGHKKSKSSRGRKKVEKVDAFTTGMQTSEKATEKRLGRPLTKQERKALRRKMRKQRGK
jgi:hypothetical protein